MCVETKTRIVRMDIKSESNTARACVCVHGCACAQWQVTKGTVSSRAIKAQGTLRQRKDKQRHHLGRFCGQPNKNKSLYAHGRIIIARQRRVAIIMPRGPPTSQIPALYLRRLRFPHAQNLPTHLFLSTPLILHNYTPTTDGTFGAGLDLPMR